MTSKIFNVDTKFLLVCGVAVFAAAPAHAGKSVSSPYVSAGELEIEAKTEFGG